MARIGRLAGRLVIDEQTFELSLDETGQRLLLNRLNHRRSEGVSVDAVLSMFERNALFGAAVAAIGDDLALRPRSSAS